MVQTWVSEYFKKQLRQFLKKDRHLKQELWHALLCFDKRLAVSLGKALYKIRLPGWNRGKSGGYRLYIYVISMRHVITPVCIHSKKQKDSIPMEELMAHVINVERELILIF